MSSHAPDAGPPTGASARQAQPDKPAQAVQECRACDLWEGATQAVMGEGSADASVMLVGEQPGDREDIEGHPFVGPGRRGARQGP